ncbi:MAG: twin-arginine translocation signal domain-containing protein [Acidimicrobiales bacterium]
MSPRLPPVSRRRFLAGSGALAGAVLLGACGDDDAGSGSSTTESPTGGLSLVQFFGGLPMLVAGSDIRTPFGVGDAEGLLPVDDTPESLAVSILDEAGEEVVAAVEVARHAEGLPRAYFPLRFRVDTPGIYTGRTEVDGEALEMAIQIDAASDVSVIQPGAAMPAVATPTATNAEGVDPICTNDPVCPLHDFSVAQALEDGRPLALLVSTPAFCQIAICGPVLEVLLGVTGDYPDIGFLHAEVYAHPHEETDTKAPVIAELGLTFEPCLVLVGSDGKVVDRLDTIFDADEVSESLGSLASS